MNSEPASTRKLITSFSEVSEENTISKGEFLIKEGEVERNLYKIESGAVRVFYLSEFEEHTIRLGYEGSLITSLSSFIKGTPSEFYIDAIRKTTLKVISKDVLLKIVNESTENMRQYVALLETLITQQIEREIDLLVTSPTER